MGVYTRNSTTLDTVHTRPTERKPRATAPISGSAPRISPITKGAPSSSTRETTETSRPRKWVFFIYAS